MNSTATPTRHAELEGAALAYAERGLYVMPLHEPMFDGDGTLTGCTCEAWKRSTKYQAWLDSKGRRDQFNPDFKCITPGKHPRITDWEANASNDPAQIRQWWQRWPTANIGLAVGKSGLIMFDLDSYKEFFDGGDLLTLEDKTTVTQLSGGGGEHLVYRMPAGKAYSNANNTLPKGIDIRGVGGMQVLAPSLHPSGNQYQWEELYSLFDADPAPLPAALVAVLDAAAAHSAPAQAARFTQTTTERPDLLRWRTSAEIRELINTPPARGGRSEADYSVCLSLVYAGATDDEILSVFQWYPIGTQGKYAERGDGYLATTIGKARAYAEDNPRRAVAATIAVMRRWGRTHSFEPYLNPALLSADGIYRTDGTDTRVFDAVCDLMEKAARFEVTTGARRIGRAAGVGHSTVMRALERMTGWLVKVTLDDAGLHITLPVAKLENGFAWMSQLFSSSTVENITGSSTRNQNTDSPDEYRSRKTADPWLAGTSRTQRANIETIAECDGFVAEVWRNEVAEAQAAELPEPTAYDVAKDLYTIAAFGEPGLRVVDWFARHAGTAATSATVADGSGMKKSTTWRAVRKLSEAHLLLCDKSPNSAALYTLADDWRELLAELEPTLRTYRLSNERAEKHYRAAATWIVREHAAATTEEAALALEKRFARLAKKRMNNLLILHPGRTTDELEEQFNVYGMLRAAKFSTVDHTDQALYEQHQRPADTLESVQASRAERRNGHRQGIKELLSQIGDSLTDGVTRDELIAMLMTHGHDEAVVKAVLANPKLMKRARGDVDFAALVSLVRQLLDDGDNLATVQVKASYAGYLRSEVIAAYREVRL